MTAADLYKVIRITKQADDKLKDISRRQHLSKSKVASRIIDRYYTDKIGVELPSPEDYKNIVSELTGINVRLLKLAGSSERTESFIKSLIHDDRPRAALSSGALNYLGEEEVIIEPGQENDLVAALSILRQFIESAHSSLSFDGKAIMQIKLPMLEFNKLKSEYDRLCTSQNM